MILRKLSLMALLLSFSLNLQAEKTEVPKGQYIAGGIVGTLIPFGIGHAIQGRWLESGWICTVGEVAGLALGGAGGGLIWKTWEKGLSFKDMSTPGRILSFAGGAIFLGFKIWEIVDVWAGATPVDSPAPKSSELYLNKDDNRFAGATMLGVSPFNIDFINYRF